MNCDQTTINMPCHNHSYSFLFVNIIDIILSYKKRSTLIHSFLSIFIGRIFLWYVWIRGGEDKFFKGKRGENSGGEGKIINIDLFKKDKDKKGEKNFILFRWRREE